MAHQYPGIILRYNWLKFGFKIRQFLIKNSKDPKISDSKDFVKILTEPRNALIKQYTMLMQTEEVELEFSEDSIREIARIAFVINAESENIGARRLHTIMEQLLEEVSFEAPKLSGQTIKITPEYIQGRVSSLLKNQDLSRYIL